MKFLVFHSKRGVNKVLKAHPCVLVTEEGSFVFPSVFLEPIILRMIEKGKLAILFEDLQKACLSGHPSFAVNDKGEYLQAVRKLPFAKKIGNPVADISVPSCRLADAIKEGGIHIIADDDDDRPACERRFDYMKRFGLHFAN